MNEVKRAHCGIVVRGRFNPACDRIPPPCAVRGWACDLFLMKTADNQD